MAEAESAELAQVPHYRVEIPFQRATNGILLNLPYELPDGAIVDRQIRPEERPNTGSGDFCSTHTCIPNFPNGTGYIAQCADGEWSHSGGRPGACSDHGGETGNTAANVGDRSNTGSTTANTGNSGSATSNTGNTGSGGGSGPLSTVNSYWSSISSQDYSSAYSDLAPGAVNLTRAQFVSQEQQAGIQSASFNGHIRPQTGATATVSVDSLTTKDKQFGCRTWSGSYQLAEHSGQWLIEQANITSHPC